MSDQAEQIEQLRRENEHLRQLLAEQPQINEESYSYRIFSEARKKLLAWAAGALVLVTAFGLYSINDVIKSIRESAQKGGLQVAIDQAVEDLKPELRTSLEKQLKEDLRKELPEIVTALTPELSARIDSELAQTQTQTQAQSTNTEGRTGSYYVIAGSSPVRQDLENELGRVRREVGSEFDELFPNAAIYPPLGKNINYALIVSADLSYPDALEMRQRALERGFRPDTFLWNAARARAAIQTN